MSEVTVIGGGLAGIAAALQLADDGWSVRLIESRARLGGVAGSFSRAGMMVDTGQHVFLRCCTEYRRLLDRLGVTAATRLQSRLDVPVVAPGRVRRARLRRTDLPVVAGLPLHLSRSLATYSVVPLRQRMTALRAVIALRSLDSTDPAVDAWSFGDWLAAHGQGEAATEALWDLIGVATLNARAGDASLALAAMVFQTGLLTDAGAADIGWARTPLGALHDTAARAALSTAGVELHLRTRARAVYPTDGGWQVQAASQQFDSDAVVLATPPAPTEALLPGGAVSLPAGWSQQLGAAPIVNLHLVYDRAVLDEEFLACVGSPLQWLFDRTDAAAMSDGRQYVVASLSAADAVIDVPVAELRVTMQREIARVLPEARTARLLDFFVTRERAATFRQRPGSARWRPAARTNLRGLVLAGAHTATGWPATMESAVRSGVAAAEALNDIRRTTTRSRSAAA